MRNSAGPRGKEISKSLSVPLKEKIMTIYGETHQFIEENGTPRKTISLFHLSNSTIPLNVLILSIVITISYSKIGYRKQ